MDVGGTAKFFAFRNEKCSGYKEEMVMWEYNFLHTCRSSVLHVSDITSEFQCVLLAAFKLKTKESIPGHSLPCLGFSWSFTVSPDMPGCYLHCATSASFKILSSSSINLVFSTIPAGYFLIRSHIGIM